MAVTSSGDGNFSSVITGGLSVNDDVIIDHDVTMDGHAPNVNSLTINSGKTLTGGGYKITCDGESSANVVINNDGNISGNLDLEINTQTTTSAVFGGSAGNCFRNVKLNDASVVLHLLQNAFIDGQLTIAAGQLKTYSEANADRTLTCDGSDISVASGAFLKIKGSTVTSRKLTSTGTLDGNGGKFVVTGAGLGNTTRTIDLGGTITGDVDVELTGAGNDRHEDLQASGNIRNLTINNAAAVIHTGRNTTIGGDLTITAGTLSTDDSGTSVDLTVAGDVSVTGTLTGNASAISFGSLSVASGGTYSATSGTTTITKNTGGTDNRAFFIHGSATFTHNNGLVKFTGSNPQVAPTSSGQTSTNHPFYDLEQTNGRILWKAEHHRVLNNCTMRGSGFNGSTGNIHVLGICRLTAETFNDSDIATNDNSFFQTLIIESGATVDLSAINITVGSLRNLGGTIQ